MGIHLHLLAEGAASNEVTDERRHTRPPVVLGKKGVSAKETAMAGGRRGMYRRNEIMVCSGRYIETVLKIQQRIRETPVRERGTRKKRRANGKILEGRDNQRIRQ